MNKMNGPEMFMIKFRLKLLKNLLKPINNNNNPTYFSKAQTPKVATAQQNNPHINEYFLPKIFVSTVKQPNKYDKNSHDTENAIFKNSVSLFGSSQPVYSISYILLFYEFFINANGIVYNIPKKTKFKIFINNKKIFYIKLFLINIYWYQLQIRQFKQ